ncbi:MULTISPECIES: VanZ family protein [unclassified Isoptericola]|uniref:VanZ family protein n=1 Tax=unclassified Isoptericola TaxID=2623355 RepID=UPI00364E5660
MISTLLVAHPWLSPAALAVLVAGGLALGPWLVARRRAAWALCAASLVPVLLLTMVPVDRELFARCTVGWSLPTPGRVELLANVVLFVAPVFLAGVALRRPLLAFAGGTVVSALVELVQALVPALGRSCDTDDWLSNTIGAALGAGLAWVAVVRWRRSQGRWTGTNPDS